MSGKEIKVASEAELVEGKARLFAIDGQPLILVQLGGEIFALDGFCTHDGAQLGDLDVIDGQIECPRHGARFDVRTGVATRMPAVAPLEKYRVIKRKGDIFVVLP